ncbi:MAG TPA: glutathione S-transferase family protein, partial [Alphaproteobacteria bacterium]|nr:glutathione S-transferase family protein [Alphaproteobacteria bacterium]
MPKLELVTAEVCPFAQRNHMTLLEKNLEFELREVDLDNKP